jgi:hypothetical protein
MDRTELRKLLDELVRDRDALYHVERSAEWWRQL